MTATGLCGVWVEESRRRASTLTHYQLHLSRLRKARRSCIVGQCKDLDERSPGPHGLLEQVRALEQCQPTASTFLHAMKPGCLNNSRVAVGQTRLHG